MPEPIDLADAHRASDPPGYVIEHVYAGPHVVGLLLRRLADGAKLGVFGSRDELDAAALADPHGPGGAGS